MGPLPSFLRHGPLISSPHDSVISQLNQLIFTFTNAKLNENKNLNKKNTFCLSFLFNFYFLFFFTNFLW